MRAEGRQALAHLGVLGVAVVAAVSVWTREKDTKAAAAGDVVVWTGRSADVERVSYEGKSKKVLVEAKKDAEGRYFTGSVEKDPPAPAPAKGADAGAPPAAPGGKVTVTFVSVGPGEKLADALGTLKALRALGKIGDDHAADFGLAEPEATVVVRVGGVDHKLLLGASTPGGGDRYVRDGASNEVYVLRGEPLRNLESADSLLLERDLHEWKDADVSRAHIEAGGKGRDVVRGGPDNKRFWADAGSADVNDETLGNWMTKLERLHPTEFSTTDPEGKEPMLKIDYTGKKPLGVVEIAKVKGADKPVFWLRTEHTRLWGKVATPAAEQLEQDLGAIVK
jgi:hypothetical protein